MQCKIRQFTAKSYGVRSKDAKRVVNQTLTLNRWARMGNELVISFLEVNTNAKHI